MAKGSKHSGIIVGMALFCILCGCRSAQDHKALADSRALGIIADAQREALGTNTAFTIERPSDSLRRQLLRDQDLDTVAPLPAPPTNAVAIAGPAELTVQEALQVGAANSREYQDQKEQVFTTALQLDLERDVYRTTYSGMLNALLTGEAAGDEAERGAEGGFTAGLTRRFASGAELTGRIGLDVVRLLTGDKTTTFGLVADASISMPLLRGFGRDIVLEPLTQAERDVLYAIMLFERFRQDFAVGIASSYLRVLEAFARVRTAEDNLERLELAGRRTAAMADAGRLPAIQVGQARQDELRARTSLVAERRGVDERLDLFKLTLGLPVDAQIQLDTNEMARLAERLRPALDGATGAPAVWEDLEAAIDGSLRDRLDLMVDERQVEDRQRKVRVAEDALRAGMELKAGVSANRAAASSGDAATLRLEDGRYRAGLDLDLPWYRGPERAAFRQSLIALDKQIRSLERKEDAVKAEVRGAHRRLLAARQNYIIQKEAMKLADQRVKGTQTFLRAGRAEVRDLLEAQDSYVSAQNALTAAVVDYRIAEMEMRRDMGLLRVDEKGRWYEGE